MLEIYIVGKENLRSDGARMYSVHTVTSIPVCTKYE